MGGLGTAIPVFPLQRFQSAIKYCNEIRAALFDSIEPGRFNLVVLDAFYRFMPRDMDENDNGTMANIYNLIDALADRLNAAFVIIHHASKGNQSGKAVAASAFGTGGGGATTTGINSRAGGKGSDGLVIAYEYGVLSKCAVRRASAPAGPLSRSA